MHELYAGSRREQGKLLGRLIAYGHAAQKKGFARHGVEDPIVAGILTDEGVGEEVELKVGRPRLRSQGGGGETICGSLSAGPLEERSPVSRRNWLERGLNLMVCLAMTDLLVDCTRYWTSGVWIASLAVHSP